MPPVAVVVASRDRRARLATLLACLRAQTWTDFELVVVDDGSVDGTPELLADAAAAGGLPLRTLRRAPSVGPSVARDDGWRATDAPLVAFTDDDCEPTPDWLQRLVAAHAADPGAILQGATEPVARERHLLGPGARTQVVRQAGPFYQCCNIAYPRAVLERVDGFDRTFGWGGEDADLAWRAIEAGTPVRWVPEARVEHAVTRSTPRAHLRSATAFEDAMRLVGRHPALRTAALDHRVFFKPSHRLLLQALAGAALARRTRGTSLALALPYARHLRRSAAGAPAWAPVLLAYDALEVLSTVRGGVRHRTFVL